MKIIIGVFFVLQVGYLSAQSILLIDGHCSMIVGDSIPHQLIVKEQKERFSPTIAEVELASKLIDHSKLPFLELWGEKRIRRAHRQYVGYIDFDNERRLIVLLMDMRSPAAKIYLQEWKEGPLLGFGEVFEKNLRLIDVNLTRSSVSIFGE